MTPDKWVDLLLNLLTEALGILVTVFFVDRLIKRREEARWPPLDLWFIRSFSLYPHKFFFVFLRIASRKMLL
jgi:hypothetical protein